MSGIVCAIRGGPGSHPTIEKAIELAQNTGLELHFLYVVNVEFLSHTMSGRVHTVTEEMEHMGEFILLTAKEKAEEKGVSSQGFVRDGEVGDEIIRLAGELEADYVVLGLPRGAEDIEDVFSHERLQQFGERIEEESGAQVIYAEGQAE